MAVMNPTVADRLVLRALAGADAGLCLAAIHAAVARDPESGSLHAFGADISGALARLLSSGAISVAAAGDSVRYRLAESAFGRGAVA
jgi:hypothetical protein